MPREIPLTQGYRAVVDDADYDRVTTAGPWFAWRGKAGGIYARKNVSKPGGGRATLQLHAFILPDHALIDHVNGDGLDNRRENLRPATRRGNAQNRKVRRNARFGLKGVGRNKSANRPWHAYIQIPDGRRIYLGGFASPEEAGRAYDAAAIEHFGEFARLNFPLEDAS